MPKNPKSNSGKKATQKRMPERKKRNSGKKATQKRMPENPKDNSGKNPPQKQEIPEQKIKKAQENTGSVKCRFHRPCLLSVLSYFSSPAISLQKLSSSSSAIPRDALNKKAVSGFTSSLRTSFALSLSSHG